MRRHTAAAILAILATLGVALYLGLRPDDGATSTGELAAQTVEVDDAASFDSYELSEPVPESERARLDARLADSIGQVDSTPVDSTEAGDSLDFDENDPGTEDVATTGKVSVSSSPIGAIYIDGKNAGVRTPGAVDAAPGRHRVAVLFEDGKRSATQSVTVRAGEEANLTFSYPRTKKPGKKVTLKPAGLIVVTNFDKADVTVNGLPYPEYSEDGDEGVTLPAGGPYAVRVTYDGKSKDYTLSLRPYETRYLIVELSGFKGAAAAAAPSKPQPATEPEPEAKDEKAEDETGGRVTVYSKPRGQILVDGADQSKRAPNTVDVEVGRHEVQVRYDDGEMSEKKVVRVRKGSRIKLFFRQKKK